MPQTDIPLLPDLAQLWQQSLNWQPTAQQQHQFQHLYELILAGNRQLNLTRIIEPLEFWEKHLWDSLRGILPLLTGKEAEGKIIDIGTGAGFPGIPVAIALTESQVTLVDSTRKKITFLSTLLTQMGIQNAQSLLGRAEILGKQPQYRQTYNIALIRAVGSAAICAEYALPWLKPGGLAVLYRGNWTVDETETLKSTVQHLGGVIESIEAFTTPLSHSVRHCVYIRKATAKTGNR